MGVASERRANKHKLIICNDFFRGNSLELGDELITGAAKTLGLYLRGITTKVLILLFSRFMKNFSYIFLKNHSRPLNHFRLNWGKLVIF